MHFPQSSNMQSIVRAAVLNKILTTPLESQPSAELSRIWSRENQGYSGVAFDLITHLPRVCFGILFLLINDF